MNLNFYSSLEKILSSSEVKFLFTLDKEKDFYTSGDPFLFICNRF